MKEHNAMENELEDNGEKRESVYEGCVKKQEMNEL